MTYAFYGLLALCAFLADRSAKWYALHAWVQERVITPFLSFQLTFNRGISWGILHSADKKVYILMTMVIIAVTMRLSFYALRRYRQGFSVIGEILVITGSISNILDRLLYGGVIDFIMIHKGNIVWPLFNIADSCIVVGVFIMAIYQVSVQEHA